MKTKDMLIEQTLEAFVDAYADHDSESGHEDADQALCELLVCLGYREVVDAFNELEKWYA